MPTVLRSCLRTPCEVLPQGGGAKRGPCVGEAGGARPALLCCCGRTRGHAHSNGKYLPFDPTTQAQGSLLQKCPCVVQENAPMALLNRTAMSPQL